MAGRPTGPCTRCQTASYGRVRPIHGRVRAVYTARPLHGRVRAVFAGEDVFTGRVHGRRVTGTRHVTRTAVYTTRYTSVYTAVRGRTTAVYTAVDGAYTDV